MMLNMNFTDDALSKLKNLFEGEGEDACIRLREAKVGSACKSKIVLKLSIDEREEGDVSWEAHGLPFVTEPDIVEQYGESFTVSLDEEQMPVVLAVG